MTNPTPYVLLFVLGLSFILLTIAFRSIVVALVSVLLNLLSVGAAYGLLTLVFLDGYGAGLFGFQHTHVIDAWVPLFLFSVLFGLSMDYQVFLMSRIKERYDASGSTRDAVVGGVATTARIITGAALIIVVVFAGFAAGKLVMFEQMGFGVAIALLLDATVIRSVVLPSTLALLDKRSWYLPRWLEWLPHVEVEGPVEAAAPADLYARRVRLRGTPQPFVLARRLFCSRRRSREAAVGFVGTRFRGRAAPRAAPRRAARPRARGCATGSARPARPLAAPDPRARPRAASASRSARSTPRRRRRRRPASRTSARAGRRARSNGTPAARLPPAAGRPSA